MAGTYLGMAMVLNAFVTETRGMVLVALWDISHNGGWRSSPDN